MTRCFSIRFGYIANNKEHFSGTSWLDKKIWTLLWKSRLYERHKVLVWRLVIGVIPTKERIKCFTPISDLLCFLCNAGMESVDHLIF